MGQTGTLIANAHRYKLLHQGSAALTAAEGHLLRIGHFLDSVGDGAVERVLADTALAELLALADALDPISTPVAAGLIRSAAISLALTNEPGMGPERPLAVATLARRLTEQLQPMVVGVEQQLLDYAFRQPELMVDSSERDSASKDFDAFGRLARECNCRTLGGR